MRAIFINAVGRTVEEVQIENKLEAFYEKIGCEMIEILRIGGNHLAIVDEEGKLRNWEAGFRFPKSEGIAGNALIVCEKRNGDFTDAKAPVELFQLCTTFIDVDETSLGIEQTTATTLNEGGILYTIDGKQVKHLQKGESLEGVKPGLYLIKRGDKTEKRVIR